jgi:hypothetical protein
MLDGSLYKSKSKSPKWVLALRYITLALQTDPIKYGIGRLTNDVIVNISVYSEGKFYAVKVKSALTTSCTCIMALCTCLKKLYVRNQVNHIIAFIAETALELTNAYLYFKKFCMDKNRFNKVTPKNHKNSPVSTYVKNFPRASLRTPFKGEDGNEGRGREGRGRDGRKESRASPKQNFTTTALV